MRSALETLEKHLPSDCKFTKPKGGYFIWITLPDGADTIVVAENAKVKYGVEVLSGARFSPSGGSKSCVRISIAQLDEEHIVEGTELLCCTIKEYLQKTPWEQWDPTKPVDTKPDFDELKKP